MSNVIIKGFMTVDDLINNTVGTIGVFGELSNYSLSFSREKGYFNQDAYPGLQLVTFTSIRNGAKAMMTPGYRNTIFKVIPWMINQCAQSSTVEVFRTELMNQVAAQFPADGQDWDMGAMSTDGNIWLPEWISWTVPSLDSAKNRVTIWLKDSAFKEQYDDYEIVVVPPPLTNLDNFFLPATQVRQQLAAITHEQHMDAVQAAKAEHPETVIRGMTYKWYNPLDTTETIDTEWIALVYGPNGDSPDAIQDAIIAHVLQNSTHPQSEWEVIFPEIFRRTEFLILPLWYQLAVEQRTDTAGIYSPLFNPVADYTKIRNWLNAKLATPHGYTSTHVAKATNSFNHPFKSVAVMAVGGPKNRLDKFTLDSFFSDYLAASNTTPDFSRQSQATCDWANKLSEAITFAHTWTAGQPLRYGLRRALRADKYWLSFNFDRIQFLIWPASNGDYK